MSLRQAASPWINIINALKTIYNAVTMLCVMWILLTFSPHMTHLCDRKSSHHRFRMVRLFFLCKAALKLLRPGQDKIHNPWLSSQNRYYVFGVIVSEVVDKKVGKIINSITLKCNWLSRDILAQKWINPRDPLYLPGLTLIPVWRNNHMSSHVLDETIKVLSNFILHFMIYVVTYPCEDQS